MVIVHSYVNLPEGKPNLMGVTGGQLPPLRPHHAMAAMLLPGRAGSAVTKSESGSARPGGTSRSPRLWAPRSGWFPKIAGIYG